MENKTDISEVVLKIKSLIESKKDIWTLKEFQNFYHNIEINKDINDNEKELLAETSAKIIAERFPKRDSKKILGDKGSEGRELVQQVFNILILKETTFHNKRCNYNCEYPRYHSRIIWYGRSTMRTFVSGFRNLFFTI